MVTTTISPGFYGTDDETFFVGQKGGVYLIQGPDMRPGEEYQKANILPAEAKPMSDSICADLDVPEECREL